MLKTSGSTESKTQSGKGGVGVGGDSRARRGGKEIDGNGNDNVEVNGGKVEVDEVGKKVQKSSRSKNLFKFKKMIRSSDFLTLEDELTFTKLR